MIEKETYVTKEYVNAKICDTVEKLKFDFHEFTRVLQDKTETHYLRETTERTAAMREGFRDELQVTFDQVKSITDKTDNHERRICTMEKAVL